MHTHVILRQALHLPAPLPHLRSRLPQHRCFISNELSLIGFRRGFQDIVQDVVPLLSQLGLDLSLHLCRPGSGTRRIREDMSACEIHLPDKIQSLAEFLFRFSGKASDDIRSDGNARESFPRAADTS